MRARICLSGSEITGPYRVSQVCYYPTLLALGRAPNIGGVARTETLPAGARRVSPRLNGKPPAFPGCKPVHLPRAQIDRFDGRLEYWEAVTETAWICDPAMPYHERGARLLTQLTAMIAGVRGSPIECYGSMDLLLRDERGEPRHIMQADESVYLHPAHAKLPASSAMIVGEDDCPDVVLKWTTSRTRAGASCRSTSRGASRKCGWRCRTRRRRMDRGGGDRG